MPRIPSANILAKDAIGQAEEIASTEEARLLIKSLGITFYNNAISEIYNVMLNSGMDEYNYTSTLKVASGNLTEYDDRWYEGSFESIAYKDMSDIKRIVCYNNSEYIDCLLVSGDDFQTYRKAGEADFPYNESIIYSIRGNSLDILFGKDIYPSTPVFTVTFRRNPVILTKSNYDTTYMDLPDNYSHLLVNRITAYAEMRKGITEKAVQVTKFLYEQMLSNIEPALKRKIFDSIQMENT